MLPTFYLGQGLSRAWSCSTSTKLAIWCALRGPPVFISNLRAHDYKHCIISPSILQGFWGSEIRAPFKCLPKHRPSLPCLGFLLPLAIGVRSVFCFHFSFILPTTRRWWDFPQAMNAEETERDTCSLKPSERLVLQLLRGWGAVSPHCACRKGQNQEVAISDS